MHALLLLLLLPTHHHNPMMAHMLLLLLMLLTDGGDGGHNFTQLELVKNGGLTGCVEPNLRVRVGERVRVCASCVMPMEGGVEGAGKECVRALGTRSSSVRALLSSRPRTETHTRHAGAAHHARYASHTHTSAHARHLP